MVNNTNLSIVSIVAYMLLKGLVNAKERTLQEFIALGYVSILACLPSLTLLQERLWSRACEGLGLWTPELFGIQAFWCLDQYWTYDNSKQVLFIAASKQHQGIQIKMLQYLAWVLGGIFSTPGSGGRERDASSRNSAATSPYIQLFRPLSLTSRRVFPYNHR